MTVLKRNGLMIFYRIESKSSFLWFSSGLFKQHFHKYTFHPTPPPTPLNYSSNHDYKASCCLDSALAKLTSDLLVVKGNGTLLFDQLHRDRWYRKCYYTSGLFFLSSVHPLYSPMHLTSLFI